MLKSQRVITKCPKCKYSGPMEMVQSDYRVNWPIFWVLLLCTAGLGLLAVPLWYGRASVLLCPKCEATKMWW